MSSTLASPPVAVVLDRLHTAARGDWRHFVRMAPRYLMSRATGVDLMPTSPSALRHAYVSVTRDQGRFLHAIARVVGARRLVEFGASFGISTLYLASAACDAGGTLITTEIEPNKAAATRRAVAEAGLGDVVTLLEGDARETLRSVDGPIDFVFLDGMKPMYVEILDVLREKLAPNALLFADNVNHAGAAPYNRIVRDARGAFDSATLFGGRLEMSRYRG
jgi:predicted O-methyltransferase YrrM